MVFEHRRKASLLPRLSWLYTQALARKAKALKATVRSTAAGRRKLAMDPTPGFNNYQATTEAVRRAHACHARRACLPRAPNRHTSHATTLPRSIGAHSDKLPACR